MPSASPSILARKGGGGKRWSERFTDAIETIRENDASRRHHNATKYKHSMDAVCARQLVAKSLGKIIRAKLRTRTFSCRRTVLNCHVCEPAQDFDESFSNANICEVCNRPCLSHSINCRTCNVIAHHACIKASYSAMYNTEEPYHCSFCVRDREEELRIADGDLKALKEHRKSKVAQRIISLLFVTAVTRIRFRKVKKSVAYIQAFHRCSLSNKYFKRWRNEQMRPVSIEFTSFPSWFSKGTVIVTLIDHVKHVQLLRCEKEISPSFTEGILVPGISSSASLVISLAFGQTIMGQAVMSLRDVTILQHESYKFAISPKITWYPVDFKGATEIWSTSNVGEGEKESFVSFDYKPFSPTNSACMSVLGQPIDFLRKAGDQKDMKKTAQKKRNTRYWMLLAKTDLVLYSYYGDPIPRVTSDISDMNCSLANTGKLMSVHHADKRNWTFEFENGGQSELFVWKAKQAQAQHQYSLDSEPQSGQDVHRRPFNYFLMK